jgi:hypothetical protein
MEYLMTYGWSILIIGVVVAALYSFNIFGSANASAASGTCLAISGFQCTNPILNSGGYISASLAEIGQRLITVTATACTTSNVAPSLASTNSISPSVALVSGVPQNLTFSCPASGKIGQTFTVYLWMVYSTPTQTSVLQQVARAKLPISSASSAPVAQIAYVPITITNSQSSATSSNFQQMVTFNPSAAAYSANEAANLGNIRFYQGFTELYSWCESGCSSGSSSAVFWVKLPSGVAASNSLGLTMSFLPTTTQYDGVYAGEAPQWTCTTPTNTVSGCSAGQYAKYDNGRAIFNLYDNFAGSTLNASVWQPCGSGCLVANSLTDGGGIFPTQNTYNIIANYFEWYGYIDSLSVGNDGVYIASCVNSCFPEWMTKEDGYGGECGAGHYWQEAYTSGTYECTNLGTLSTSSPQLISLVATSLSGYTTMVNYVASGSTFTDQPMPSPNQYPFLQNNGGAPNLVIQYARERSSPPRPGHAQRKLRQPKPLTKPHPAVVLKVLAQQ